MEAVRICLTQNEANYRKEESIDNKMTYPLPPFSMVIGALHKACGYREYHKMNVSIQGKYGALKKQVYTENIFLNSLQDDRNILVKMKNPDLLSCGYDMVAAGKKTQGNSFRKGITIQVHNQELLEEYRELKDISDAIKEFKTTRYKRLTDRMKQRKSTLSVLKKQYQQDMERLESIKKREKEIKELEKICKQRLTEYEEEQYKKPISYFRTLVKGPKFYEVLTDVELIIHVQSDHETLIDICNHIHNLTAIGRSEDFVEVKQCELVELKPVSKKVSYRGEYSAYLSAMDIAEDKTENGIQISDRAENILKKGTRYSLNKEYTIVDGKRQFKKKSVLYTSTYYIKEPTEHVWVDTIEWNGKNMECIVDLV